MNENDRPNDASHPPSDMTPHIHPDLSPDFDDGENTGVKTYDFPYILALVRVGHSDIPDADLQDIALEALISFTPRFESGKLDNPDAYLAQVIRNKCNDYYRQQTRRSRLPTVSLSTFEDHPDMKVAATYGESLINPANEIDEELTKMDTMNDFAAAIARLPTVQQHIAICTWLDNADNPVLIEMALKTHNIDESQMRWPKNKNEKRVLQASLPAARRALANMMHIDLSQYKPRKRRPHPPASQDNQL